MTRRIPMIAIAFALAACAKQPEGTVAQAPSPRGAPTQQVYPPVSPSEVTAAVQSLPEPDRSFLLQASGANMSGIRFGQLASERGSTVEVRSLGREMVDTNTALNDQLRRSASTVGVTLPIARMTPHQQQIYSQLSTLSGPQFDAAFLRAVTDLQHETIASFQNEALNGRISEMAMLANQTLPLLNQRVRTVQNQIRRM